MEAVSEADLQALVRGYAAHVMGCSPDTFAQVGRLEGGNRHAVFKVERLDASNERAVVVRVSHGSDLEEQRQAEREAKVLEAAGGVAAPVLYDFRQSSTWFETPSMCLEFIPGRHRDLRRAAAADLESLGSALGSVHQRPTQALRGWLSTADSLASYAQERLRSILDHLSWARDPLPISLQIRLRAAARTLERRAAVPHIPSFKTPTPLALLHGDPAGNNIRWSHDPVLIDWEYARIGDPAD